MHIVALNGSYRGTGGVSHALLARIQAGAAEVGGTVEIITLARHKINRCLGCGLCQTPDRYLQCVQSERDDVHDLYDRMAAADVLIFATPVYVLGMSVLLKTLLDRAYGRCDVKAMKLSASGLIFHHIDPVMTKPFVPLVVCGNVEAANPANIVHFFRQYARFHDAPQVGLLVRNASDLFELCADDPALAARFPKVAAITAAYAQVGRDLATQGRIRRETQRRANQEAVPFPLFRLLKRFRPVKQRFVVEALKLVR